MTAPTHHRTRADQTIARLGTGVVYGLLAVAGAAMVAGIVITTARWPLVGAFSIGCGTGAAVGLLLRSSWLRRVMEAKGWLDEEVTSLKRANYLAADTLQQVRLIETPPPSNDLDIPAWQNEVGP